MLKKISIILCLVLSVNQASAQFTIDEDTLYAFGFAGKTSSDFIDLYGHTVIRSTGPAETITWNRISTNYPNVNWSSAICDIISCRPPETSYDSFAFANGGDTGVLSFHFYVKNYPGQGEITVRFSRATMPTEYKDVVIKTVAWDPVSINALKTTISKIMPNPSSSSVRITNSEVGRSDMRIYSSEGKLVYEGAFSETADVDIRAFASGVYTIMLRGEAAVSVGSFIKE